MEKTMRKYLTIGSLGLGLGLLAVATASAEEANNRIISNRIITNKIATNRISINQVTSNRIAINGLTTAPAGAGAIDDIVAIDLADGTQLTR